MQFTRAIVRKPGKSLVDGIASNNLGKPDYQEALKQHQNYIRALEKCGLEITVLEENNHYPDSVFVEDPAVLTKKVAIITNPGAESRKGEEREIKKALGDFYQEIASISPPGTLEGGDVMQVEETFYIGLSGRTNAAGAGQLANILESYGYRGIPVDMNGILHLKTGLTYLGDNNLLAVEQLASNPLFKDFNVINIRKEEAYAANCIRVNDYVLIPAGYPQTQKAIEEAGYQTLVLDVAEFRKLDGGLSCLSLRF